MTKVHVVCGGDSSEREVSLRSGSAVADALRDAGYEVAVLDTSARDEELKNCDVVFPVLHGVGGEDGQFQVRLESLGMRFVGSDSASSKLCMDKGAYRDHMVAAGFRMANGAVLTLREYLDSPLDQKPHVIKPVDGGSSIDTLIIRDITSKDMASINDYFIRYDHMIVEQLVTGTEITVGVYGKQALPIIEIIPPVDGEFDFANKYNGTTQELCPPEHVSSELQKQAQELTLRVHEAAGCRDLSRTDYIITPEGGFYLLETNTIPGMTGESLYPKMGKTAGIDFPELMSGLVQMALER
jgi:D-alanine-D-alanine ligase